MGDWAEWTKADPDLSFVPLWRAIERWLRENDPARGSGLRSGATAEDVSTVERLIGAPLPASMRFAYMRHNGEEHNSFGFFGGKRWLPLLQMVEFWQGWQRQFADRQTGRRGRKTSPRGSPQVPPWDPLRIPFSYDWGRGYHCVDLQPPDGVSGRIVMFEFASEEVVATSFEEWLATTFGDLASGKWEFGMYGGLVPTSGSRAEPGSVLSSGDS